MSIAGALVDDIDIFLAETMSTEQEMLCAVRAAAAFGKPVIVSMAGALRNRNLQEMPSRAATVAELVLQEVEQGRADIPVLCFNCAQPETCSQAVDAIPQGLRQRLRESKITLGIYPNMNAGAAKRQTDGVHCENMPQKMAKREDLTEDFLCGLCDQWMTAGVTYIGGCCGSTPEDIKIIAAHLKRGQ